MKSEHKDKKNLQFLECKNQRRQWQNLFIFEPFFIFCISYEETHCQDNAQCIRGDILQLNNKQRIIREFRGCHHISIKLK